MVTLSATILHHGHIRLLQSAASQGRVIVGLTSDKDVEATKGYVPEIAFDERKEIIESILYVDEVVETPWLITEDILDLHKIDLLIHGDDNTNIISPERLLILPRTEGISSSDIRQRELRSVANIQNEKLMLTPGPAGILENHLSSVKPLFGRGDSEFETILGETRNWLKKLSGQDELMLAQGSASFALKLGLQSLCLEGVTLLILDIIAKDLSFMISDKVEINSVAPSELELTTEI